MKAVLKKMQATLLMAHLGFSGGSHGQAVDLSGMPDYPLQAVTEATWSRSSDNMRWMSSHFSVKPSLVLSRGARVYDIPLKLQDRQTIEQQSFMPPGSTGPVTLLKALQQADVDSYLVLKDGKLIYQRYFGGFSEHTHHSWFSGAKSLIGMAIGILAEQGQLDVDKTPSHYISALRGSAYESVNIRQALNMTAALSYTEDPNAMAPGHFRHEYLKRAGMLPPYDLFQLTLEPGQSAIPRGVRSLLPLLEPSELVKPGTSFDYQNINVDLAGWLIEVVSGVPLDRFLRDSVWSKLQAEHDAFIPTDPNYTALAAGGLSSTARDLARFGLAVAHGGVLGSEQVFPASWINDTCQFTEADRLAFDNRRKSPGDFSALGSIKAYRNYWYIHDRQRCAMASRGYGGQSVYINRARGVVIVTFASATAANRENNNRVMYITHLLADGL
ncbi:MAG: serine hydrolase domain-containing protein [Halioglobus sp.]